VDPALSRLGHKRWRVPLARLWQKPPITCRSDKKTLRNLMHTSPSSCQISGEKALSSTSGKSTDTCEEDHTAVYLAAQRSVASRRTLASEVRLRWLVDYARSDPHKRAGAEVFRRLVHALAIRNGDCRKLPYMQAAS
jgi:hypothetical protein